jgi:hypothetical protein
MTYHKENEGLLKGKKYLIEGIEMVYLGSESTKHYFQKIDERGKGIGRRRMLMGVEDKVVEILEKKERKSNR